jgi:glycosyltransferase involved in cell wall biosynthesis
MILVELTHTSHTLAATGIQQVCRNLYDKLGKIAEVDAIVHDPWQSSWRSADAEELERLRPDGGRIARKKGEAWKFSAKIRGRIRMLAGIKGPLPKEAECVIMPEFVMNRCLAKLPELRALLPSGTPVVAVFHDAIALEMPQYSAKATLERFPRYIAALAKFDAIAAVSEFSKNQLLGLWKQYGIADVPPVKVIPLGISKPGTNPSSASREKAVPRILCVSTLEPRKNHVELLNAAEMLWRDGLEFELDLVGMAHRELGAGIVAKICEMEERGRRIYRRGAVDDAALCEAYRTCDFTVYCSLMEGFGLPVVESLAYGKPCVCTTCGALDEVSRGGGCLRLCGTDASVIAEGLRRMLTDRVLREKLVQEAAARSVRTWIDYAGDILEFTREVRRRAV